MVLFFFNVNCFSIYVFYTQLFAVMLHTVTSKQREIIFCSLKTGCSSAIIKRSCYSELQVTIMYFKNKLCVMNNSLYCIFIVFRVVRSNDNEDDLISTKFVSKSALKVLNFYPTVPTLACSTLKEKLQHCLYSTTFSGNFRYPNSKLY